MILTAIMSRKNGHLSDPIPNCHVKTLRANVKEIRKIISVKGALYSLPLLFTIILSFRSRTNKLIVCYTTGVLSKVSDP